MAQLVRGDQEKEDSPPPPSPDGGWGWMVVLGAALINLVNQSMFANFGLIFGEHLKELANGRATGITLVMALSVVVTNFSGLLVGPMLKKFSISTINIIGISFTGSGMIVCSYSTALWHFCIGYGCMTGLGLGLLASGTFLAINDYFTTRKSTAVGMSMAGTGIGQMTMPPLIGVLLKRYEFDGTSFILGFVSFSGIIGALLFKPRFCCKRWVSSNPQFAADNNKDDSEYNKIEVDQIKESEKNEESTLLPVQRKPGYIDKTNDFHYRDSIVSMAGSQPLATNDNKKESWMTKVSTALGLPLLKDLTYVHIVIGLGFGYVSSVSFSTFFPLFLQDEAKLSLMYTTYCMTALSSADVVGRITAPEIARRLKLRNRNSFMIGCVLLAIARSCLVTLTEFKAIFAVAFFSGYFRAITVINQNLVISDYIDKENLPCAVGLNMVTKAILTLTFGQSLGFLKDYFSYAFCIHLLDIILCIVVLCYLIERFIKWTLNRKHEVIQEPETTEV